jgi:hypothetical protein
MDVAIAENTLYYSAVFWLVGLVVGLIIRFLLPSR